MDVSQKERERAWGRKDIVPESVCEKMWRLGEVSEKGRERAWGSKDIVPKSVFQKMWRLREVSGLGERPPGNTGKACEGCEQPPDQISVERILGASHARRADGNTRGE